MSHATIGHDCPHSHRRIALTFALLAGSLGGLSQQATTWSQESGERAVAVSGPATPASPAQTQPAETEASDDMVISAAQPVADAAASPAVSEEPASAGDEASTVPGPADSAEVSEAEADQPPAVMTERTVIDLGDLPDHVTFTFQEAPWAEVLREFAEWSGLTLDLTDTPPGSFSYFDSRPHTPAEAIDILNGYLLPRGYVVLRRDQFLVVIRTTSEMLSNLIPTIDVSRLNERGDNELVKAVVPVENISPEVAAEEIRGLLGPFGAATPLASSQSIVLQGFGSGLRAALETLKKSRPPVTDDKLDFRSFTLEHLPVADAESQIRRLFGIDSPSAATNVSHARSEIDRANYLRDRSDRGSRNEKPAAAPPIPLLKKVAMNMQVSSLGRTNNLLVTATPEGLALVEEILEAIDVPSGEPSDWAHESRPALRVYKVSSADESEVAKTIDALMPGVVVNEDTRQDTIHIFGTPQQHEEVGRLMQMLDQGEGSNRVVEVIPLRQSNPIAAATLLEGMFKNEDRDERPMIQAEIPSRSLVVRGTSAQVAQIREALVKFGEPAQPASGAAQNSRVRRIVVGGRSAEAIAGAAERILAADDDFRGSVRVVVPGDSSGGDSPKTSEASKRHPVDSARTTDAGVTRGDLFRSVSSRDNDSDTRLVSKATSKLAPEPRSRVSIEVQGDELLVYSGDPESLDTVEEMIRDLVRQMPDRTRWTVFYLKVAEAEKAAVKLMELMTADSYAASTGLAITSTDQQPLRIIPDKRTNAVFFSGTDAQVAEAEGFLEYIDASEVPGSFLRREPHAIPVEYADVDEIADLLRNLYKDYLIDPVAERMRQERSSDSRDRDGRSRKSSSAAASEESPGVRLTLAVDRKTGELLVACNDQLFEEIEAVVRQRDLAVRDSQPTVEFLPISGDLPANIVEMLDGMSSKVTAETIVPTLESSSNSNRSGRSYGSPRSSSDRRDRSRR